MNQSMAAGERSRETPDAAVVKEREQACCYMCTLPAMATVMGRLQARQSESAEGQVSRRGCLADVLVPRDCLENKRRDHG
jgi:hypothetical protein